MPQIKKNKFTNFKWNKNTKIKRKKLRKVKHCKKDTKENVILQNIWGCCLECYNQNGPEKQWTKSINKNNKK